MKSFWLIVSLFALLSYKSKLENQYDPAFYAALKNQPDDYTGLSLVAHQYADLSSVIYYLETHDYPCNRTQKDTPYSSEPAVTICQHSGFDFLPGKKTIYLLSQSSHIRKAVGKRELPAWADAPFWKKWFGTKFFAPGINFATIKDFSNFVVDSVDIPNDNHCLEIDMDMNSSELAQCREWLDKRKQQGWPHWNKQPVDVYTLETALQRLKRKGFQCPDYPTGDKEAKPFSLDQETAWLQCSTQSLSGQTQRVALGFKLEDSTFYKIRLELGKEQFDIPLKIVEQNSHLSDRNVIVQADDGTVKQISLMVENNRNWHIPPMNFRSRQRLLNATVRQADIVDQSYQAITSIPKLQQLDRLAYLFVRLGPEVFNEWRTTLKALRPDLLASIVIAECMQGSVEQAKQCFLPHLAANPQLVQLFTQAIAEIEPYIESLSNEHSIKKRLHLLSSALIDYRQFVIPQ